MSCDAKIRPFTDDTEIVCDLDDDGHQDHHAVLHDYAYPGSTTALHWDEHDRRNFRGDWAPCTRVAGCTLPALHRGSCAP